MILKYTWTPTINPWDYDVKSQREGHPTRDHIKQIHALAAICRHLRYEVIDEYFAHAQAHIIYTPGRASVIPGRTDIRAMASMYYIKHSPLFTAHLQHVRLNWLPANTRDGWLAWEHMADSVRTRRHNIFTPNTQITITGPFEAASPYDPRVWADITRVCRQPNTVNWLTGLKKLRTLEITFLDVLMYEHIWPGVEDIVPFYNAAVWQKLLKGLGAKLEWVSFKLVSQVKDRSRWDNSVARRVDGERVEELVEGLLKDDREKLMVSSKSCLAIL